MRLKHSHAWLRYGFPLLFGVVAIGVSVVQIYEASQQRLESDKKKELQVQNRLLIENMWASLDGLRLRALALNGQNFQNPWDDSILFFASLRLAGGDAVQVQSSASNPKWKGQGQANAFLQSMLARLNLRELREKGITLLRVKQDPLLSAEWLAFAFREETKAGRSPEEAVLVLTSPESLFSVFKRLSVGGGDFALRAYLLTSDGMVLAHSTPSYIGSNFRDLPGFRAVVESAKKDISGSQVVQIQAIDRNPVSIAYAKVGVLPLVAALERVQDPPFSWSRFINWGTLAYGLGIPFLLMAFLFLWRRKHVSRRARMEFEFPMNPIPQISIPTIQVTTIPASVLPMDAVSPVQDPLLELHRSEYQVTEAKLSAEREVASLLNLFEKESFRLRDPKMVAQKLTEVTAQICKTPTLFFAFRHEISAAILQSDAGFLEGGAPATLSFPVKDELLRQIQQSVEALEVPSVSNYEPLANILLARTGVSHFAALALVGFGPLGRQSGKVRLLGILVLLQAGADSVFQQESLQRMMRSSGLIYENALLSR